MPKLPAHKLATLSQNKSSYVYFFGSFLSKCYGDCQLGSIKYAAVHCTEQLTTTRAVISASVQLMLFAEPATGCFSSDLGILYESRKIIVIIKT